MTLREKIEKRIDNLKTLLLVQYQPESYYKNYKAILEELEHLLEITPKKRKIHRK